MENHPNNHPKSQLSPEAIETLSDLNQGFNIIQATDCTPPILSRPYRVSYGVGLEAQNTAMITALGGSVEVLTGAESIESADSAALSELLEHKPAFFTIDNNVLSDDLRAASSLFDADEAGAILRLAFTGSSIYGSKIDSFPAIKNNEVISRILVSKRHESDHRSKEEIENSLNYVTLPSQVALTEDSVIAAVRFVEDDGLLTSITQSELDDWLDRYEKAGLDVGNDISTKDESLDNFILYRGALHWCDGDVLAARPFDPQETSSKVEAMRDKLQYFVKVASS
jgi:hypothetical protein